MNKINDSMKKKNSAIFPLHGSSQVLNLKYCFSEHLMSVTLVRTVCPTVVFAAKIKKKYAGVGVGTKWKWMAFEIKSLGWGKSPF